MLVHGPPRCCRPRHHSEAPLDFQYRVSPAPCDAAKEKVFPFFLMTPNPDASFHSLASMLRSTLPVSDPTACGGARPCSRALFHGRTSRAKSIGACQEMVGLKLRTAFGCE